MTPPVERTKGRGALPATVVVEQDRLSSPWVGLRPMTSPVEMTKGRAALPATVVAEQDPFFIALVGRRPMTSPVEMTKGRAALPTTVVAEQDPFFTALGGPKAHDSSGRKTFPRKGPLTPQISPLRWAPVEMTKGRAALPATVVAEQDPFFIALGGPKAHDSSGRDDQGIAVTLRKVRHGAGSADQCHAEELRQSW